MATSSSTNFILNRDQIINGALRKMGILAQGESPDANMVSEASEALNVMVNAWQTEKINLWTRDWTTKVFSAASEVTGTDSSVYTCIKSHTSSADNRPVTGGNWTTYWFKRGSTGGVWATSTSYTSTGDFEVASDTLNVEKAFIRNSDGTDTWIEIIPYEEYLELSSKSTFGRPNQMALDRQLTPKVYIWPQLYPVSSYVLHYLRIRRLEDYDSGSNTSDFPVRWTKALIYGLAADLAEEYNRPLPRQQALTAKAEAEKMRAKMDDHELFTSARVKPKLFGRRGLYYG